MPRTAGAASIDEIVRDAMTPIVARASQSIAHVIAELAARELERRLGKSARHPGAMRSGTSTRHRPSGEMIRWVADRRARRVPKFVIEATKLDTKKKLVAKFGENAAFEKGKPLPPIKARVPATAKTQPPAVKARPPIVRKAAGAG